MAPHTVAAPPDASRRPDRNVAGPGSRSPGCANGTDGSIAEPPGRRRVRDGLRPTHHELAPRHPAGWRAAEHAGAEPKYDAERRRPDAERLEHLSARRHLDEGGSGEHERRARGASASPRSRRRHSGTPDSPRLQVESRRAEMDSQEDPRALPAQAAFPPPQAGISRAAGVVAPGPPA